MAETEGFEPSVPDYQYDGLANRWFQPLTHVSGSQRRRAPIAGGLSGGKRSKQGKMLLGFSADLTRLTAKPTRLIAGSLWQADASILMGPGCARCAGQNCAARQKWDVLA